METAQPIGSNLSGAGHTRSTPPAVNIDTTTVVTPTDRVRWGAVMAGLFIALSTMAVLGTLGTAIGASAYDPGDSARNFGIGAGMWGIISMLVAFAFGGWLAARAAAVRGHHNGLLNGAMVWAVAIPLMAYVVAGLLSNAVPTAANVVDAGDRVNTSLSGNTVDGDPQLASARIETSNRSVTAADTEVAADRTAMSAWTTLAGLLLSLGAASLGGYLGGDRVNRADSPWRDNAVA